MYINKRQAIGSVAALLSLLLGPVATAQTTAPDSLLGPALSYAQGVYHAKINERAGIFSGPQYAKTANPVAHPFFQSVEAQRGSLRYEGLVFTDVDMLYDTQADQVIVKYPNSALYFSLLNERVAGFTLNRHTFRWLTPSTDSTSADDLPAGFYDIVLDDTVSVLAKRIKVLSKAIVDRKKVDKYDSKDKLYVVKNKLWYPVKNKRDVFLIFPEYKKDIISYVKKERIKFDKKNREVYVLAVAHYLNKRSAL